VEPVSEPVEEEVIVDLDENMLEEPLPGGSSAPALPTAVDTYNFIQSNLMLARECMANVVAALRPRNLETFGEDATDIPNIQDFDLYVAQTNTAAVGFTKKCGTITKTITQAIDQSTKVAQHNYVCRIEGSSDRQRLREDIARRQAAIIRQREQLRRDQEELEQQQAELRPRRGPRNR